MDWDVLLVFGGTILIFILMGLKIILGESLIPQNETYQTMLYQINKLDEENQDLKIKIATEESLRVISTKAAAMGFINTERVYYITK